MPSPFPGMNPYLEQPESWHDFHCSFFPVSTATLVPQVRPKYIVKLNRRLYRESVGGVVDEERKNFAQIEDRETREVITVIELLSPSDMDDAQDRSHYLAKRELNLGSTAHFIEIDLLRGGRHPPLHGRPDCDYCVSLSRADERSRLDVWPFRLRDRLPVIPVPLRAPDADVILDLKAVLDRVYDAAGYEDYIYSGSPVPPLSPDDQRWAEELLTSANHPT